MILFNEVKRLAETSGDAFTHFYNIMSRKDNGIGIWVPPIMMLPPWLPGHKFKNIIFER